ncbi:hypothetical protein BKI52_03430 [marine bacterium AO1-C]|nr:hypothetical protein BKI52_03430 [marine bacterium AO1-C]
MRLSSFTMTVILLFMLCVKGQAQNSQFVVGNIEKFNSKILGEDRTIYVHVPRGDKNQKYPVMYLLDGGGFFPLAVSILKLDDGLLPKMIIVGISNRRNRTRDLTPRAYKGMRGSGGGEKFTQFLEKELIPYIDGKYATRSYRTLVGYSLGGLLAINTLVNHTDLFNNYIVIDPSLRRDKALQKKLFKNLKTKGKYAKKAAFLAVANTMEGVTKGLDTSNVMQDKSPFTRHIRAGLKLAKVATHQNQSDLRFAWKYYPNDSHSSVPYSAIYHGLRAVFSWYKMDPYDLATAQDRKTDLKTVLGIFHKYYAMLSKQFGYKVLPEENYLNSLGYMFLETKQPKRAKAFFQLAIAYYPKSANVYDSMADYYIAQKDRENALEHLEKAYKISKDPFHKNRIDKLKAKK